MSRFSRAAIAATLILATQSPAADQGKQYRRDAEWIRADGVVTVIANSPRPLSQAIDAISKHFGKAIDYEDPPYASRHDVFDVTADSWKRTHPEGPRALTIAGGSFRTTFEERSGDIASRDFAALLAKVVADYNSSGNPGRFEVRALPEGRMAVVGVSISDDRGQQVRVEAILDTPVRMASGRMLAGQAFDALGNELRARAGRAIGLSANGNLFDQVSVELPGVEMPARRALFELIRQMPVEFQLRSLYDAGTQAYFINVTPLTRYEAGCGGNQHSQIVRKDHPKPARPCSG